jgi:hypothetical protein
LFFFPRWWLPFFSDANLPLIAVTEVVISKEQIAPPREKTEGFEVLLLLLLSRERRGDEAERVTLLANVVAVAPPLNILLYPNTRKKKKGKIF